MCEGDKIILTYLNGTGYIFNVDDYMKLRIQHHIIGSLVGTNNTRGWSASENALPVELSICETRLLVEEGIALLVSKKESLLRTPTDDEVLHYKEQFEARILEQADMLKAEKLRDTERNMDKILVGKRKKLLKEGVPECDIKLEPNDILKEIGDKIVFDRKNALIDIKCEHPEPHSGQIVKLPLDNSFKYRVFRNLWQRGKYVTAGDAFGADFLIYPGDPLLYHASHVVILVPEATINPLLFISKVRLSVSVNKICIFAYMATPDYGDINEENADGATATPSRQQQDEICYQTVTWEGGSRDKEKPTSSSRMKKMDVD